MILTATDLLTKTHAVTAYTHSDEITIIFNKICTKVDHDKEPKKYCHNYNGRISKLLSLTASYCSVRFNYWLNKELECINTCDDDMKHYKKSNIIDKIKGYTAYFDCRVLLFPEGIEESEIINHMIWRSTYDCYRNCISTYADHYIGKNSTFKMNTHDKIIKLYEIGIVVDDIPKRYKYGIYLKQHKVIKTIDYINKQTETTMTSDVQRSQVIMFAVKIEKADGSAIKLIMDRYLNIYSKEYVGLALNIYKFK
jgi:tRNA(His) guanylyltransferase